jgi:hypothetical protein
MLLWERPTYVKALMDFTAWYAINWGWKSGTRFPTIRGQFALTTIAVEVISRVPVLDDVGSLVDLPLNLSRSKIVAEKDRLFSLSNFDKRFLRRLRHIVGVVPGAHILRCRFLLPKGTKRDEVDLDCTCSDCSLTFRFSIRDWTRIATARNGIHRYIRMCHDDYCSPTYRRHSLLYAFLAGSFQTKNRCRFG